MTTYYVKNGGNNIWDGLSDATAWATVSKVNDFAEWTGFEPGDVICFNRGDKWSNDETLGNDGTAINWGDVNRLTFQAYGIGANPSFDGNTQRPIWISRWGEGNLLDTVIIKDLDVSGQNWKATKGDGNLKVMLVDNVVLDGITGIGGGHDGDTTGAGQNAILVRYGSGSVEVKNCALSKWGEAPLDVGGRDLIILGVNSRTGGTISIHDNDFSMVQGDCIQPFQNQNYVSSIDVYDNLLYDFTENCVDMKASGNSNVYRNECYLTSEYIAAYTKCEGPAIVWHSASSINDEEILNGKIYSNYIHDIIASKTDKYESSGIKISGRETSYSNGVDCYNNLIVNCGNPFRMGSHSKNVSIYSNVCINSSGNYIFDEYSKNLNTVFSGNTVHGSSDYMLKMTSSRVTAQNNIFYATANGQLIIKKVSGIPTINNNIYYNLNAGNNNIIDWDGVIYAEDDQSTWIATGHPGAQFTDPLFVNAAAGNLTLQSTSPAINAGVNLGADYDDALNQTSTWPNNVSTLNQNSYGTAWEIGAYVYAAATSPITHDINIVVPVGATVTIDGRTINTTTVGRLSMMLKELTKE